MTSDILFEEHGPWGVIRLNRPKALNAITREMGAEMDEQLTVWAGRNDIRAVMIEGEGDRAFCAGGDIRWLHDVGRTDPAEATTFFRTEYTMNARIAAFPKPYVALMDGIVMGGGVGLSAMASHRVVTDRTLWAMPECGIGLMPDVGSSYFLRRLGAVGYYLGLVGARLTAADCLSIGLGTTHVEADGLTDLRHALLIDPLEGDAHASVDEVLRRAQSAPPEAALDNDRQDIERLFTDIPSIEILLDRLEKDKSELAQRALASLRVTSPTSQKLTLALFNGAPEPFNDCIAREYCAAAHLMASHDFHEGVRAQIVDKDKSPRWSPKDWSAVTDELIDTYFDIPPGGPLNLSSIDKMGQRGAR
ncbi:enoyl-CoA hydratase/isomerase family protein [Parvularcula sp. LCG005]|uniref:enoyl-CoA hydratase/isomerase family protein n=1 Tax=Parvularcula sp. LCG005 TaxID=3078805 RepID=UPI002943C584|nr:enoyl-CoA hydratase/isomerase family protein [Parvularcula sp. LCG005]WOI54350.1 enoyl-CoA hydratase/isomerase family protein [Parvularcula sp. LCG005]